MNRNKSNRVEEGERKLVRDRAPPVDSNGRLSLGKELICHLNI
jgi:hypothetical protein